MTSTIANKDVEGILRSILEEASGTALIVDPSSQILEALVDVAIDLDGTPTLRMLAAESTLKDVMADFLIASNTADLIEDDTLEICTATERPGNALIVTDETLTALVVAGQEVVALSTAEVDFVDHAYDFYTGEWEAAEKFSLRTPPLSRVRSTLREEIGSEAEADFDAVLKSLDTARGDGQGLDEVTISLLVAAKNDALLYDISKWGEDVGIASKATFSRTKTKLEDMGILDTEKVPIDVGRPRLRLKLAHEQLQEANAEQLASVAQGLLN